MWLPLSNSTVICAQGHPFMESLLDNKALLYSLLASGGFVVCMVTGSVPEINQQFEIVTFPPKVIPLPTRMRSDWTNLSVRPNEFYFEGFFFKSYSSKVRFWLWFAASLQDNLSQQEGEFKKASKESEKQTV